MSQLDDDEMDHLGTEDLTTDDHEDHAAQRAKTGDPSVTLTASTSGGHSVSDGGGLARWMTMRDYFAAHAPTDVANWFTPVMKPRPAPEYSHDHPNERQCQREYDCPADNAAELSAYDDERARQWSVQWPYAWADAMLRERAKVEGREP